MNNFQKIDDKRKWLDLLSKVLFKTFFHNLEWEEFLEKQFKWLKFERYLYRDEALLSLANYKLFGKEKLVSHPFCEYGGILPFKTDISGREFKKNLFEEFKSELKIKLHPKLSQYFKEFGLKAPESMNDTYLIEDIDKKSKEEIYGSFRKTLKHSIKKAESGRVKIEECKNKDDLRDFYRLYLSTVKRHKNIPYPFSFFEYFFNSKKCEIVLGKHENKIIAGSTFLFYDKFIHYFINASNYIHRDKELNCLILWDQIKKHVRGNYEIFDLGGTGRGSELKIFKRGWGAKKYPIFEIKNFRYKDFKRSRLRDVLSILPSFLLEKTSTYSLKYKL